MRNFAELYGVDLTATVCEACDRTFLVATDALPADCPHCQASVLAVIEETDQLPPTPSPELIVPFEVSAEKLTSRILEFSSSYRFTPDDLTPDNLQKRMTSQFLPVWLVDSEVSTEWQAEVGFDYGVVSHSEAYRHGQWETVEKTETRTNWEPRVGHLQRQYDNVRAPALEDHAQMTQPLGKFRTWDAVEYSAEHLNKALIRLPSRSPADAWEETLPTFMKRCEADCQTAAGGQHIRQFHWKPEFSGQNWTSLLLPVYTSYYLDDDGKQVPLLIHGRTGRLSGRKVGSLMLAKRTALILAAIAVLLVLIVFGSFAFFGANELSILLLPAIGLGLLAIYPLVYVSNLNRKTE